ncbi:MAG TPA: BatD family protein [Gemmatimonadales bacterium]|nr:BatD family protein [Gemmatimonadales bacterium]
MILPFILLALQHSGPLRATATLDHSHVAVGDVVTLTIRVRTESSRPVTYELPTLGGVSLVRTRETADVSVASGGVQRTVTRELMLRVLHPGSIAIAPIKVHQGTAQAVTRALAIIADPATGPAAALSPRARDLVDRASVPARNDDVSVALLVLSDTVLVGEQLDVLVAAWFPRDLRLRLRAQPRITLPVPVGGWSYPEERIDEPVGSKLVQGRWMDLYVVHGMLFPLVPGRLVLPPASVEYGLPVSFSIFSREERYSLRTDSLAVIVIPPPREGRPNSDDLVVGSGFTLLLTAAPLEIRVGEPMTVTATVHGVGNASLWPAPDLHWPTGFRAYPAETNVALEPQDGFIAGTKTFSYLVVPDSAGAFTLPEVRYSYFDLAARRYGVARTAPQPVTVLSEPEQRAARALPPLLEDRGIGWPDQIAGALGPWGWGALVLVPPLVALAIRARRRGRGAPPAPVEGGARYRSRLGTLERRFQTLLASHVPDVATRDGDSLARALRAAGIESAVADHVMRLRDRLRAARYGPGGMGDPASLVAELEQVLRGLGADQPRRRRRFVAALGIGFIVVTRCTQAQAPTAEALYSAGALRAAADSFAARAALEPDNPAHWYNLGAALYRAGEDGRAVAAWTMAARHAPRNPFIERARRTIPAPDLTTEDLLVVSVATPAEWALAFGLAWLGVWLSLAFGRRAVTLVLVAIAVVAAWGGAAEWQRRARPLAVVIDPATSVRVAPYGTASAATTLDPGSAILVRRTYGRWLEVYRDDGISGWVLGSEVVRL